jgi:hypothetical protein
MIRKFETGATRDLDQDKYDYEGFLSPLVIEEYARYMHKNRRQRDGSLRDSDNWQKGIPFDAYMKSGWRHFFDWWKLHRQGRQDVERMKEDLCGILFNTMGYLHELTKEEQDEPTYECSENQREATIEAGAKPVDNGGEVQGHQSVVPSGVQSDPTHYTGWGGRNLELPALDPDYVASISRKSNSRL